MTPGVPGPPPACGLCGRSMDDLTRHHLIPRKQHRRKRIRRLFSRSEREQRILWVCRPCHDHIHKHFDEQTLAERLNTAEALLAEPVVQDFVVWIARHPPGFKPRS
ncbi:MULTISPECIES: hypothetical protein [unclassified Thioalkalivibrio]|uniref:hypothetical protein n=1 Tax=unclassified Thioalkalivibrio TaxID=2621013 RepID=UPI000379359A|nr:MULTISPECIES: hypothetical protein [unclassified Thioalkalivibrio]